MSKEFESKSTFLADSLWLRALVFETESHFCTQKNRVNSIEKVLANIDHIINREDSIIMAQAFHDIGKLYRQNAYKEDAIRSYQSGLNLRSQILESDHVDISHSLTNIGSLYIDINLLDSAYIYLTEGLLIRERLNPVQPILTCDSYTRLSQLYLSYLDTDQAIYYSEKAINVIKAILPENHPTVIDSYVNLATLFLKTGEYSRAYQYSSIADNYFESQEDSNVRAVIANKVSLGRIFTKEHKYEEAVNILENALNQKESKLHDDLYSYAMTHLGIAKMAQEKYEDAGKCFVMSAGIISKNEGELSPQLFRVKEYMAQNEFKRNRIKEALTLFDEVVNVKEQLYGKEHYELIHSRLERIKLMPFSDLEQSESELVDIISVIDQSEWMVRDPIFITANIELAKVYKALHIDHLKFETKLSETDALIRNQQSEISTVADQLIKNQEYSEFYDLCVEYFADKVLKTGHESDAAQLFKYIEQSKGNTIFQSLRQAHAWESNILPDTILKQKRNIKFELNEIQSKLKQDQNKNTDHISLKIKLIELQESYLDLIGEIETSYPEFYQKKYSTQRIPFHEFQSNLAEDQLAINYYLTDGYVFALSCDKNNFYVSKQSIDEGSLECVESLLALQSKQATSRLSRDRDIQDYVQQSLCIFKGLIEDHITNTDGITRLVFIPHKQLNNISFETICSQQPAATHKMTYKSLDYLLKKYAITYLYAASFPQLERSTQLNSYVGFAPSFIKNAELPVQFYDLPVARQHIQSIAERTGGQSYVGDQSTLKNFRNNVGNFDIVHISTHAQIDENMGLNSKLWLAGGEEGSLNGMTVEDIYQLELPGSLVILSACQTGKGDIVSGEGPVHFSHAFTHAGARNSWMSLWSIPEHSTAMIISDGLDKLEKGMPMDIAIQQAKLKYIEEAAERTAAPFYWGGMVSVGNMNQINTGKTNWSFYGLIIIVSLLSLIFFLKPLKFF